MNNNYLLLKAEMYLNQSNYKRCLESCICILSTDHIDSDIIIKLGGIFQNLTEIKLIKGTTTNDILNLFDDFLNLLEGIDIQNLFSPLFSLHFAKLLITSNLETHEVINQVIVNALSKTEDKFFQVYGKRLLKLL